MIEEITREQIGSLRDDDLRELIAKLCERELKSKGFSTSAVTWGGDQTASDGGIDVRVSLPAGTSITGYIPAPATGFQVKAQ